jgi:RNA polymerase sigma factor (sigma-70 family)
MARLMRALRTRDTERQTDGQLLARFLGQRDEAAFAALVERHGSMVLAVCRRVLGNVADAEDAFQATFLVLVRKAGSLSARSVLGDWLHGVARRTALKAKAAAGRRSTKEQATARRETQVADVRDDRLAILDDAISNLPEKYRLAVVLCDLEGWTRQEAASRLGWPEGTVAGRLARARTLLARRLTRRGVVGSAGALSGELAPSSASASVPAALVAGTVRAAYAVAAGQAAAGVLSSKVALLTGEVMQSMSLSKVKIAAAVLILCVGTGFGLVAYRSFAVEPGRAGDRAQNAAQAVGKAANGTETDDKEPAKEPEREKSESKAPVDDPITEDRIKVTSRELIAHLQEVIDSKDFQNPMTLKEALGLIYEKMATRGKELPILIDVNAFNEENPKGNDVYDTQVLFPPFPKTLTVATMLKTCIARITSAKAELVLRATHIEITTEKQAALPNLLQTKVLARFENRPVAAVVNDLAASAGISVALDPRVEEKAKTAVTVTFRNDVTVGGALRIVADMAGLKIVDMKSGLYLTSPANAKELEKELGASRK